MSPVPESVLTVVIDGQELKAYPKRFSSGSVGWYASKKMEMDGVQSQLSLSLVVVGSKPRAEGKDQTVILFDDKGKEVEVPPQGTAPLIKEIRKASRKRNK